MEEQPVQFSYAVMVKKGVVFAVNYAAGYAAVYGFDFTPEQKVILAGLICSGLAMLRNKLKMAYSKQLGWL